VEFSLSRGSRTALSGWPWRAGHATVLRALVQDTPRAIWPERAIGRFAEEHEASFIVLDGDPLDSLALEREFLLLRANFAFLLPGFRDGRDQRNLTPIFNYALCRLAVLVQFPMAAEGSRKAN
jgi:hypothetical protein